MSVLTFHWTGLCPSAAASEEDMLGLNMDTVKEDEISSLFKWPFFYVAAEYFSLMVPTSASSERNFSRVSGCFGKMRKNSRRDLMETSVQKFVHKRHTGAREVDPAE